MAETIHVNGVSNSLAHKGCMGFVKNTLPDVCKTPSPGGPIPIPYPVIVSFAKDLSKGTKTVKVDGGNSAAIKGSEYSRCIGDEPGTAGGIISSTNMKEATWLLYSFDVKMDGKNACRLSDKMMMNHKNTVSLGGAFHATVFKLGDGDLNCSHPNMKRSENSERRRRQLLDKKRTSNEAKAGNKLRRAIALEKKGQYEAAAEKLRESIAAEEKAKNAAFEQRVNTQTNAIETGIEFYCPKCGMQGEIDTVTEKGVVKECKDGKPSLKQLKKIESASKVLFPGSPVHLAVPEGMKVGTPWTTQRH